LIASTITLSGK